MYGVYDDPSVIVVALVVVLKWYSCRFFLVSGIAVASLVIVVVVIIDDLVIDVVFIDGFVFKIVYT